MKQALGPLAGEPLTVARPLVFLLPFFMTGLVIGRTGLAGPNWIWPAAAAACAVLPVVTRLIRKTGPLYLGLVFGLLGAAMSASTFAVPDSPRHVYHLTGRPMIFGGLIAQSPQITFGRTRIVVDVDEAAPYGEPPGPAAGRVQITVPDGPGRLLAGTRVRFPAELDRIENFANPGAFDYEEYQTIQGVRATGFLESVRLIAVIGGPRGFGAGLVTRLDDLRNRAADFIDHAVGQPTSGLIKAMLIGRPEDVPEDWTETFRRLGLAHLLAISGLHVGLVAAAAFFLIRKLLPLWPGLALRVNLNKLSAILAVGPVWFYAAMAGGRPSTIRAAVMVSVFLLALLIDRRKDYLNALAAAAWIVLIASPGALFLASFQMSFAAAAAIILLVPRFPWSPFRSADLEGPPGGWTRAAGRIWGAALVPTAALLGIGPISAYHFHHLPWLSLPANLVFASLLGFGIVPFGLAALALTPVWPAAARFLLIAIERFLWIALPGVDAAAGIPGIYPLVPQPGFAFFLFFYAGLLLVFFIRPARRAGWALAAVALPLVLSLVVPAVFFRSGPELSVTILDVGQGQAVFVRLPDGSRMMIDGGGFAGSDFDVGENITAPFLLSQGITRLDILGLSHPQIDHLGGLPFLAAWFHPKELWQNGETGRSQAYFDLMNIAEKQRILKPALPELHRPRRFGPAEIRVLAPPPDYQAMATADASITHEQNDNSLVVKITFGRRAFLFPGDIEALGEKDILQRIGPGLRADVLIAPHHGSRGSASDEFLAAVRPMVVVFSVGRRNRFGFPHPETLARVEKIGAKVLRTDRRGAVTVTTDGENLKVNTWLPERD